MDSPLQMFEKYDDNKDGQIDRSEFEEILLGLNIHIEKALLDILFLYIDLDGSGAIEYKEFCRRLKRVNVKAQTREKEFIKILYHEITDSGFKEESESEPRVFDRCDC